MAFGKFGKSAVYGRKDDSASAAQQDIRREKQRAELAAAAKAKAEAEAAAKAKPKGGGGGAAKVDPKATKTAEQRGAEYKAHWESTWKATADQARTRVAAERAAAAKKPVAAPPAKGRNVAIRRRGKGAGGGQFV